MLADLVLLIIMIGLFTVLSVSVEKKSQTDKVEACTLHDWVHDNETGRLICTKCPRKGD
jgi:hypothetical protein